MCLGRGSLASQNTPSILGTTTRTCNLPVLRFLTSQLHLLSQQFTSSEHFVLTNHDGASCQCHQPSNLRKLGILDQLVPGRGKGKGDRGFWTERWSVATCSISNKFNLNQKYIRGWWINPGAPRLHSSIVAQPVFSIESEGGCFRNPFGRLCVESAADAGGGVQQIHRLAGSNLNPQPYTLHLIPHTLHPTPYTLQTPSPTPHTPHPTPHTLHSTSRTLHPTL